MMPYPPCHVRWTHLACLFLACASLGCLSAGARAGMQLSASSHEPAPRDSATAKQPVRTLLLGDARYAIPEDFFYGPLDDPGERQRAVLFSAWLSDSAPAGANTLDADGGNDAAARRLVILIESMQAYPDTARRDSLLANYRLYAGDMDITGTAPAAPRDLSPALAGLMRVTLREPAALERARYPDIFIEGEELRPTAVMGCSRVGVRGVGYAVCSLHFRVEGADVSVDMKREHMTHWRAVRSAVTEWLTRYRVRAR
jgi:hypothetical protein